MKNIAITLLLAFSFAVSPVPALAQTDTGPTPGSFWYGITTTFENVNLFFTFNNEKKAEKALTYAERRLAQAKSAAETENTGAIETALADYEAKLTLATESSKKIDNDEHAKKLLTSIADNTAKHQETLSAVLEKVPEEAQQAITKAIEASKRGQEEATQKISELKSEVEKLRQEIAELKIKDEEREQKIEELSKQKTEKAVIQPKPKTVAPQAQTAPTQKTETTQSQTAPKTETPKTTTATFPNGAVVEMDANGNTIRTIKEAPEQTYTSPVQTTQSQSIVSIEISSVVVTPGITEVKIEWQTNTPSESNLFLSGGNLSSQIYKSASGVSTRHSVKIVDLNENINYTYEIEAVVQTAVSKKQGSFKTLGNIPTKIEITSSNGDVGSGNDHKWSFIGRACTKIGFYVQILDQSGNKMSGLPVTVYNSYTKTEKNGVSPFINFDFGYSPIEATSFDVIVRSGSLESIESVSIRRGSFRLYTVDGKIVDPEQDPGPFNGQNSDGSYTELNGGTRIVKTDNGFICKN